MTERPHDQLRRLSPQKVNVAMPKPSLAYVNGQFVPIHEARISILDRGFLFADGVYEVVAVINGRLVDHEPHLRRLRRSLEEIQLGSPVAFDQIPRLMEELIRQESLQEGLVYTQITRGADSYRDFPFPESDQLSSTLVMFVQEKSLIHSQAARQGIRAITIPDIRWRRRDIKSIALLPQVLGKQMAVRQGVGEAWMVEDGYITEGTSSAVGIISDQTLITRPVSNDVLDSITRRATLNLAAESSLVLVERRFTPREAYHATEAFVTSATALVMPIVEIDGHQIGDGQPGPHVRRLREIYLEFASSPHTRIAD